MSAETTPHSPESRAALPELPSHGRSTAWLGVGALVAIEATAIASMIASYFYLRMHALVWPPGGEPPKLALAAVAEAFTVAILVPVVLASRRVRGAASDERPAIQLPLAAASILAAASFALKLAELRSLPFRWSAHAYGSIVWTLAGYGAFHILVVSLAAITLVVFAPRWDERGRLAVHAFALYAYFAVASSLAVFATEYLSPRL